MQYAVSVTDTSTVPEIEEYGLKIIEGLCEYIPRKLMYPPSFDGSIVSLIECYKNWDQATPLHTYFTDVLNLSAEEAKELWLR